MTTASNVGGGDSLQLGGKRKPLDGPKQPKGANVRMVGSPPLSSGGSTGEHSNDRRERLRRITGRAHS